MRKIDSECCVFNAQWKSKYFVAQVSSKAKCLIIVFHDTVSFVNMSVIIKSHRTQVTQVKQNRKHTNVFMYMRMCLFINSK